VEPDGRVFSGAAAAFRALASNPRHRWLRQYYERQPRFAAATEWVYRLIARNRPFFSWLTRLAYGAHVEKPQYFFARWAFLRALGVIYLIAFISLGTQVDGLIGTQGILPTDKFMPAARQYFDAQGVGWDRYRLLPTLCWWNASDSSLQAQCAAGMVLSVLLIVGIAPAPCLFLLWLVYLSLSVVAREFLGFQWDILLLETGLLAIFLAPWQLWPKPTREAPPSRLVIWLLRLLVFKLMVQSGWVKLLSGDTMWRDFTALTVHYETQPLPTWIGWYAHQLPVGMQQASCALMFGIELFVPIVIFAPRRPRIWGAVPLVLLQVLILLTGNYTFFNWLTLALCGLLLDDFVLAKLIPQKFRSKFTPANTRPRHALRCVAAVALALLLIPLTAWQLLGTFSLRPAWLSALTELHQFISPLRSINSYGLFAVMTRPRNEIIIEGSADGLTWKPYEFEYKPGAPPRRPGFVAPHQPRLDWQMWFAALGRAENNPWFTSLCVRLLEGSPPVLELLESNPFPDQPPRYVRATFYEYHFTNFAERRRTGNWWRRELKGLYLPPLSPRETAPAAQQ
jgi:hypothetical protein